MPLTRAPAGRGSPISAAMAGPNLESRFTPRKARDTFPVSINWLATYMNMSMGMANPIPSFPPELLAMAVLIPMTSARRLTSGPPLLPGLMAASVCMKSWKTTLASPNSRSRRPLALTIP